MRQLSLLLLLATLSIPSFSQVNNHNSAVNLNNVALIIGTSNYSASADWAKLSNPVYDAQAIGNKLQFDYGYRVIQLQNPPKDTIIKYLEQLGTVLGNTKNDYTGSLVVYIAGHGGWDATNNAYIVPTDAKPKAADNGKKTYLLLSDIKKIIEKVDVAHKLLLVDAVYGSGFDGRISKVAAADPNQAVYQGVDFETIVKDKLPLVSSYYITSGGKEYQADDRSGYHSPFASGILAALDSFYYRAQPISIGNLAGKLQTIYPEPHAGTFGRNSPGSDFILFPNSFKNAATNKPKAIPVEVVTSPDDAGEEAAEEATTEAQPLSAKKPQPEEDNRPSLMKQITQAADQVHMKMKFEFIEGGLIRLGDLSAEFKDENPVQYVQLQNFFMSRYEVTQKQWYTVMGTKPSKIDCESCPVQGVSWVEVQKFIRKFNARTGKTYRLPTEAEWEFAARGGNKDLAYEYSGSDVLTKVGWYSDNSDNKTHEVGQKQPNGLGLFDMSGNVSEWCLDPYKAYIADTTYNVISTVEYDGSYVVRGGNFMQPTNTCRNTYRSSMNPKSKDAAVGFRLVMEANHTSFR
jgi:formylglycine-generating enzyme required for sulfatase activity